MLHSKKTLVVGASLFNQRYSYLATEMLTEYGHSVIPFGIKNGNIGKLAIVNVWPSEKDIDTITLYINKTTQLDFYTKIIRLKPRRIIFNPGTENTELQQLAQEKGILAQRACTLVLLRTNQY